MPNRHSSSIARIVAAASFVLLGAGMARAGNTVGDSEILIGMSAPFSGFGKEYGRQLRVGFELAFAAVNEASGVAGRKLRLVPMDDGFEVARTVTAVRDLVDRQKVFALTVHGTANVAAVLPFVLERQVLLFAPYSGASMLRRDPPDRYVFNFRPSFAEETSAAIGYLMKDRKVKLNEIAVFSQDDGFGEAGWEGVARYMRKAGRDPSSVLHVRYKHNTIDVGAAVETVRRNAGQLRAVVMIAVEKPAAKFIERLRGAGVNLFFTNVSAVSASELAEELVADNPAFAEGIIVTQVVPLPSSPAPVAARYRDALHRYFPGESPDFISLEGYVSGSLLVEGLRRAGRGVNSESVVDALESIRGLDLGLGAPISFGPSEHQASHQVWGTVLERNGQYRSVDLQ
jgi:branched-chain amino acid transport system substrate-binding protein